MKQKLVEIFISVVHEVAERHPVLENYKDELLQTFVEYLGEDKELVEKYSCLSDDELKDRTKKVLETVIENTVLETVLNRLDYVSKKIEKLEKDVEDDHKTLARGLNNIAKAVGNHGRYIERQLEEVKNDIGEVKGKIDEAKEEISKEISDTAYYLTR